MNTTEEREISVFLNNNLTQFSFKGDEKDYQKQENVRVKLFLENNKFEKVPQYWKCF
jgi:hypothetical protein